ncbi:Condensin-2 complex subunit G2 [Carpediemonas membranifera]|uniref:Condensin-2 complex subunit G2 n=1 Tax=Carpediemonas membranifera TaxID=201153 RepID=A0A8J6DXV3_9EUKA|nr:Condensin-2 complex subunit G2 [Carpediemonas membranifera]|eukprot:KAG9391059.1 Condensin-2 complex subunit G2 [Carpediemonas membranifera]
MARRPATQQNDPRADALQLLMRVSGNLAPKITQKDIRGLPKIVETLSFIDDEELDEEEFTQTNGILLAACSMPDVAKIPAGRRFLTTLIECGGYREACATTGLRTMLLKDPSSAGNITAVYLAAHANDVSVGPMLRFFAKGAVLAEDNRTANACRAVIAFAVASRSSKGVDALLTDIYRPTVIPHATAAAPLARKRVATLLGDAFPLIDEEDADLLNMQRDTLVALLLDPVPAVRAAAVRALAPALAVYYEALPAAVGAKLVTTIVRLASDSVPSVRSAALAAVTTLLGQPLIVPIVRPSLAMLLPRCRDGSRSVRVKAVGLIESVAGLRRINLYDVLPLADLLSIYAAYPDSRLADIMFKSVIPESSTDTADIIEAVADRGSLAMSGLKATYRAYAAENPAGGIRLASILLEMVKTALSAGAADGALGAPATMSLFESVWSGVAGVLHHKEADGDLRSQLAGVLTEAVVRATLTVALETGDADTVAGAVGLAAHMQSAGRALIKLIDEAAKISHPIVQFKVGVCRATWEQDSTDWTDVHQAYGSVTVDPYLLPDSVPVDTDAWVAVRCEAVSAMASEQSFVDAAKLIEPCSTSPVIALFAAEWIAAGWLQPSAMTGPAATRVVRSLFCAVGATVDFSVGDVQFKGPTPAVMKAIRRLEGVPAGMFEDVVNALPEEPTKAMLAAGRRLVDAMRLSVDWDIEWDDRIPPEYRDMEEEES